MREAPRRGRNGGKWVTRRNSDWYASANSGPAIAWRRDGKELFYFAQAGQAMMAVLSRRSP